MDMQTYYDQFENCMQEEKAFCADDCPFHMDVLDFEDKIASKRYGAAYKVFRNAVVFPDIVASLCPQYCARRCPGREAGGAIQVNAMERTCLVQAKRKDPNEYNLPPRKGRIAIIGAGLSGLSCALRLASKKYDVTVYEKDSVLGGQLNKALPREMFMEDIERQFKYEDYTLRTDMEVAALDELAAQGFDAVYIATGKGGDDFGALSCPSAADGKYCFLLAGTAAGCHGTTAVFAGGSLLGKELMPAAADGVHMAREIEGFLKTGIIRYPDAPAKTQVTVSEADVKRMADCLPVTPTESGFLSGRMLGGEGSGIDKIAVAGSTVLEGATGKKAVEENVSESACGGDAAGEHAAPLDAEGEHFTFAERDKFFTPDEAAEEAARCIRCQCNSCMTVCDLTAYFNKWPLQMRDEIMTTTMPANSMIRKAPAIRLINMCTQCGLCGETCPGQIDLGGMIKEARRMMHKIDRMPGAYHQFWVRDMEFANGKYAALAKCPPGKSSCSYAFFPGCHLGAANPFYVKKAYAALLAANGDTGLLLRCCGVPADWAGNEEIHEQAIASLRSDWEDLGKPVMVMACPSCMRHFREYLPEIPLVSLYEVMDEQGICEAGEGGRIGGDGRGFVPISDEAYAAGACENNNNSFRANGNFRAALSDCLCESVRRHEDRGSRSGDCSCANRIGEALPLTSKLGETADCKEGKSISSESVSGDCQKDATVYSVFDPCAARNCDEMQEAVRHLLSASGTAYEELPSGDKHGCCGFGGNIEVASPKLAAKIADERSKLHENPYITYCINCRDVFHDDGKPVRHILDILLDIQPPQGALPTVTERRCNRVALKEELLEEIWDEPMNEKPEMTYELMINPDVKAKMNALRILEEDVCYVLEMGELQGRRTFFPQTDSYKCYREIGRITCWVEYKPQDGKYEICNVYTHRMKIELEVVFNGRKTDLDLR